jgi:hypothetical protein
MWEARMKSRRRRVGHEQWPIRQKSACAFDCYWLSQHFQHAIGCLWANHELRENLLRRIAVYCEKNRGLIYDFPLVENGRAGYCGQKTFQYIIVVMCHRHININYVENVLFQAAHKKGAFLFCALLGLTTAVTLW